MSLEEFPSLQFLEEFEEDLKVFGRIHPVKPSDTGLLFVGSFLITDSISLLVISLLRLIISS